MTYICERCGREFGTESLLTSHQQQEEGCKFVPVENRSDPCGITPKQKALLHRRADGRPDEREQWGIVWRIAFPKYEHLEPSPYVDDSVKVDAVFHFAHSNGLGIAKTIPGMADVPEAAIKTFIQNIRNGFMSSGQIEDIPPPMDSPDSDDSPRGETMVEPPPPFFDKEEKGMPMKTFPGISAEDPKDVNTGELFFDMPVECYYGLSQPNFDGLDDFGSITDIPAYQYPGKVPSQHDFAGATPFSQMGQASAMNYTPMPQSCDRIGSTEPADQQDLRQGRYDQPRHEPS